MCNNTFMMKNYALLLAFVIVAFNSCTTQKTKNINANIITLRDSYCKAPTNYDYEKVNLHVNSDSLLNEKQHLRSVFNQQSILILNALNSLDDVENILELKKDTSIESQLKIMKIKDKIDGKITLALSEVDAVAAEFDCEGERVAQMANYVSSLNNKKNNKMIVYSIAVGALGSVAGGFIKSDGWDKAVDIGGGLIGAGFGLALLNPKGKKVEFIHARNILRDIWQEKLQSRNFPPFIWYMYTEKKFSNLNEHSIIQNMKQRWIMYQFEGDVDAANASPIFNDGGKYDSEALNNRAAMLNQMQSATRTINQNINYLLIDLNKLTR